MTNADVPDINVGDMISRQAAIDAFKKELTVEESKGNYVTICSAVGYEGAKQILERLPSAERKGKWITYYHGGTNFSYSCNQCGAQAPFLWNSKEQRKTRYCYNCGARMERIEE